MVIYAFLIDSLFFDAFESKKRNGLFSTLWRKKSQINAPLTMSGARNPVSTAINPLPEGLPFYYNSMGYIQRDSVEGFEPWESKITPSKVHEMSTVPENL